VTPIELLGDPRRAPGGRGAHPFVDSDVVAPGTISADGTTFSVARLDDRRTEAAPPSAP